MKNDRDIDEWRGTSGLHIGARNTEAEHSVQQATLDPPKRYERIPAQIITVQRVVSGQYQCRNALATLVAVAGEYVVVDPDSQFEYPLTEVALREMYRPVLTPTELMLKAASAVLDEAKTHQKEAVNK